MGQALSQRVLKYGGGQSSAPNPSSSSLYCSKRIQSMIENKGSFSNETELDIEFSKAHLSKLTDTDSGETRLQNREHFEELQSHPEWGRFFNDVKVVTLGVKLAEGAQAEIYDAKVEFVDGRKFGYGYHVVEGDEGGESSAEFPTTVASGDVAQCVRRQQRRALLVYQRGETMVDHRFGIVIVGQWGNLCKLIDLKMRLNGN